MIADNELEELEVPSQEVVERAFVSSGEKKVADIVLQPYTPNRVVAAQNMGLRFGYLDMPSMDRFRESYLYPGAVRDVAILMWLCGKATKDEIYAAGLSARPAVEKAEEWAASEGLLNVASEKFKAAYEVFFEMMNEVNVSRSTPQKKTDSEQSPRVATV